MELQSTQLSDAQIVELYWQRDQAAIAATDAKYQRHLMAVARNIVHDPWD